MRAPIFSRSAPCSTKCSRDTAPFPPASPLPRSSAPSFTKIPNRCKAPPALEAIVRKCLSKSPNDRFQSATELRQALESASTQGPSGSRRYAISAVIGVAMFVIAAAVAWHYLHLRSSSTAAIESIAVLPLEITATIPTPITFPME